MIINQKKIIADYKNKSVVVFLNFILSDNIYKLHKEIIINLLDIGAKVSVIRCNFNVRYCSLNPYGFKSICDLCVKKSESIVSGLNINTVNIDKIETNNAVIDNNLIEGSISSISSFLRKSNISSEAVFLEKFSNSSNILYFFLKNYILKKSIDSIFLFNGRFSCGRSAILAAENLNIDYFTYDYKKNESPLVFKNNTVHNIYSNINFINKINIDNLNIIVKDSLEKRIRHLPSFEKVYTKNQVYGLFDSIYKIPNQKKIISFFMGSEDEFISLGKYWGGEQYYTQIEFIEKFASKIDSEIAFVVRMHPNQNFSNRGELSVLIKKLRSISNVYLIPPDIKVDSYEIVKKSKIVISSMSFIGVESIILGVPSFFISNCIYSNLISNSKLKNIDLFINNLDRVSKVNASQLISAMKIYYFFPFLKSDLFVNIKNVLVPHIKIDFVYVLSKIRTKFLLWLRLRCW